MVAGFAKAGIIVISARLPGTAERENIKSTAAGTSGRKRE